MATITERTEVRAGRVGHVRACRSCDGEGHVISCEHGGGCPCPGRRYECEACRGSGESFDVDCACTTCTAETLWPKPEKTMEETTAPAIEDKSLQLMTASRAKVGRACKRKHHLMYDLGYRPAVEAETLFFGSLFHDGMEAWWRAMQAGVQIGTCLALALKAMDAKNATAKEPDPYVLAKACAMMIGYHERWKDEPLEVLGVEESFELQLVNPETNGVSRTWKLGGRLDVRVRDLRDGLLKVMEHKTSSEDITPGSAYWKRLRMDSQVSIYYDGHAVLAGELPAACLYDVALKPLLKPGNIPDLDADGVKVVVDANGNRVKTKDGKRWRQTADAELGYTVVARPETPDEYGKRILAAITENPEKFYARGEVVRLESELDEARFDLWSLGKEIREGQVADRYPRNPDACNLYNRTCPFFEVCTGEATLDDTTRFTRLSNVHPELAEGTEATPKEEA